MKEETKVETILRCPKGEIFNFGNAAVVITSRKTAPEYSQIQFEIYVEDPGEYIAIVKEFLNFVRNTAPGILPNALHQFFVENNMIKPSGEVFVTDRPKEKEKDS